MKLTLNMSPRSGPRPREIKSFLSQKGLGGKKTKKTKHVSVTTLFSKEPFSDLKLINAKFCFSKNFLNEAVGFCAL